MVSVATSELEANTESKAQVKSLTGKDLPEDWPKITPDEEYRHRFDGFKHGVDSHIERFSYLLEQGDKHLLYLAVEHSSDPKNLQFEALENKFNEFHPDIVLYEGPNSPGQDLIRTFIANRSRSISHGEKAFTVYLAQEQNIPSESADIQDPDWINGFKKLGHSNEEIAVHDILRKVYYLAQEIKNNTSLTDPQKRKVLEERNIRLNNDFEGLMKEVGFPELFSMLPREDGVPWNTETIKREVENQTGQPLNINLHARDIPKFNQMFEEEAVFRDQYQVKRIAETVKNHDRVMVVMGSAHPFRQEAALRELFDL